MFTHFLITRFNLRKQDWNYSKNKTPLLTEEWLKNRFQLFDNFCFPSVLHQTNKNFFWLVYFDTQTPDAYRDKIINYHKMFSNLIPLYIDGMPQFYTALQAEIKKTVTPFIVTTRLDNDDCISKYFVDEVQKRFAQQPYLAIDFIDGYTIQTEPLVKAGMRRQAYNPFISLIERNETPKTVLHTEHAAWKKEKNLLRITNTRIWMSVIHHENKINRFAGYGNVNLKTLFSDFIINEQLRAELIKKQKTNVFIKIEGVLNKLRSHWRTLYSDIKKRAGLYK